MFLKQIFFIIIYLKLKSGQDLKINHLAIFLGLMTEDKVHI